MPVQKRSTGWFSRVVVPTDLRPFFERSEIVRSLRTQSKLEARHKAHAVEAGIFAAFDELRRKRATLSTDQLRLIADRYLRGQLDAAEESAAVTLADSVDAVEIRSEQLQDVLHDDERGRGSKRLARAISAVADALLAEAKLDVDRDSPAYKRLLMSLLNAQREAASVELRLLRGEPVPSPAATNGNGPTTPAGAATGILLSEAVNRFASFKGAQQAWTDKTTEMHLAILREMVELLGDVDVSQLSKAGLLGYYETLPKLPSNAGKKWPGLSAAEVLSTTADMDIPRLSPRSINKRLILVRSFLQWTVDADIVPTFLGSILKAVPEGNGAQARLPLTDAEVLRFIKKCSAEAREPAHEWLPKVCAYGGLRLDEAGQLDRDDVVEIDGVWCLRITAGDGKKLKTSSSARVVPIHSAILAELLAYREGVGKGNLWGLHKGRDGHTGPASKWFARKLDGVVDDSRKTFHSLRHSVATKLKGLGVHDYQVESLLGHTTASMSMGRYGKAIPPGKLLEVVELIEYRP